MKSQIIFRLRPVWFNPSSKNNKLKKNFPDLKRRIWAENEPLLEMPVLLPFNVVDKVFSSDQWNFDTKNVRYSTLREKKFQIMKIMHLAIKLNTSLHLRVYTLHHNRFDLFVFYKFKIFPTLRARSKFNFLSRLARNQSVVGYTF